MPKKVAKRPDFRPQYYKRLIYRYGLTPKRVTRKAAEKQLSLFYPRQKPFRWGFFFNSFHCFTNYFIILDPNPDPRKGFNPRKFPSDPNWGLAGVCIEKTKFIAL